MMRGSDVCSEVFWLAMKPLVLGAERRQVTLEEAVVLAAEVADPNFLETYAAMKARLLIYEEWQMQLEEMLDARTRDLHNA